MVNNNKYKFKVGNIFISKNSIKHMGLIVGLQNNRYDIFWIRHPNFIRPLVLGYDIFTIDKYFKKI
jgi:hypothetical protein